MIVKRIALAASAAAMAVFALAGPASAHTGLESSDPADGSSIGSAPTQIKLTFEEPVSAAAGAISVTGADGNPWTVGKPTAIDKVVTVPVQPSGPAGKYTVTYKVSSADGDNVTGKIGFTLTAAVPTTPATTAPTTTQPPTTSSAAPVSTAAPAPQAATESSGMHVWIWIVLAVIVVILVAAFLLRRRANRE
jgi:methionine-rich copper-binding protein CopC